jgi:hypothetical protein
MYENRNQDGFMVKRVDGTVMQFFPSPEGLYYYGFQKALRGN